MVKVLTLCMISYLHPQFILLIGILNSLVWQQRRLRIKIRIISQMHNLLVIC